MGYVGYSPSLSRNIPFHSRVLLPVGSVTAKTPRIRALPARTLGRSMRWGHSSWPWQHLAVIWWQIHGIPLVSIRKCSNLDDLGVPPFFRKAVEPHHITPLGSYHSMSNQGPKAAPRNCSRLSSSSHLQCHIVGLSRFLDKPKFNIVCYLSMHLSRHLCMWVWMGGWIDVWMDVWMDECMYIRMLVPTNNLNKSLCGSFITIYVHRYICIQVPMDLQFWNWQIPIPKKKNWFGEHWICFFRLLKP